MSSPLGHADHKQESGLGIEPITSAVTDDLEGQPQARQTQIVWDENDGRSRRGRRRSNASVSRRRSASRDSIRSVQDRVVNSNATIPIEFRTLSFGVSTSRDVTDFNKDAAQKSSKHKASRKGDFSLLGLLGFRAGNKQPEVANDFAKADEHIVELNDLYQRLRVSPVQGLSADAATKRLETDGKNVLPSRKPNYIRKLLGYIFGGFCSILWIGVIIFFICWRPLGDPDPQAYNLGLAVLVIIVILLQAAFSAFQDWSTAKTMNSILDMLPSEAMALRDGSYSTVKTIDIVPGDIVSVSIGDKVPADMRLISTSGDVRFDRSAMTGESEEVEGQLETTDTNFLETKNIALGGTMVTNGNATGIVVFTGAKSVMGGIAMATASVPDRPTSIQREVTRFVTIIVGLTVILASLILFSWVGWLRVDHFAFMNVVDMLDDVMGCVVAFIPEGMPVGVALTLMLIARRMKQADVLPKSLATVEMLGCVEVICSDKTGTLTKNEMVVQNVGFVDGRLSAAEAEQALQESGDKQALIDLHRAAHLCNDASFDPRSFHLPIAERQTQGNITDGAILKFAEAAQTGSAIRDAHPRVAHIAFNSKNKFTLTLHSTEQSTGEKPSYLALVKGAPDILVPKCTSYFSYQQNTVLPLDAAARSQLSSLQAELSNNAERVLLLCQRTYQPSSPLGSTAFDDALMEEGVQDLTVIGVVGIFDPPRMEAAETVATCRRAGVRFFMMTGDFGLTAAAIARQVGIFTSRDTPDSLATLQKRSAPTDEKASDASANESSLLLEAGEISALTSEDWDLACQYQEIVFARCSPDQKLLIINEFKHRKITTAVTGDGINDAPAMKAADVGIAMVNGSDVALEAADLVLLGSFESIVTGIRLGRLVFQNLQKVISYLLPAGSWSEIWPVLLNVFFGVPLPLSSFLMIIICVFTDLFMALSLIMEKEEFDLLSQPPRNVRTDHLINLKIYAQSYLFVGVMETICAHSMFFLYYWRHARIPISALFFAFEGYTDGFYGYSEAELTAFNVTGQSVYFVTLVILQLGNILSIRNKRLSILQADPIRPKRRNPWLLVSATISISIAIFVTMEPGIQSLFGTASVPVEFWFIPIPLALGILVMDEIRKLIVRTFPKSIIARIAW